MYKIYPRNSYKGDPAEVDNNNEAAMSANIKICKPYYIILSIRD